MKCNYNNRIDDRIDVHSIVTFDVVVFLYSVPKWIFSETISLMAMFVVVRRKLSLTHDLLLFVCIDAFHISFPTRNTTEFTWFFVVPISMAFPMHTPPIFGYMHE